MNTTNEISKPFLFCLDKSNNSNLKQHLCNFSTRFFNDGKCLIKSILLNKTTEFYPCALILTGDFNSIKEILTNQNCHRIKIFIFCQNFTRQIYEPLMIESKSIDHIIGLFTTIDDLKDALEDILIQETHNRQVIRFITGNLEPYLWYEFLKETSFKIDTDHLKQPIDISNINRQMEYDPLITLYTLRSSIRNLLQRKISNKKIFYGNVIKKTLIEKLQSNINNIISFNSFIQYQGHDRIQDARHQSIQCCSRRSDEVSIIFELELADQPTFKIIRVFNSNHDINLWIVQLIGTHECVKLSKQFSHVKRTTCTLTQWQQQEILFGQILIEMNEIDKAYTYFFHIFIKQYDQLNKIYTEANQLWQNDKKYTEAIAHIATEFQKIKSSISSNKTINKGKEEITYFESEIDSTWETPITLEDTTKINDLLAPISYQMDQVLTSGNLLERSKSTSKNRCCSLF
ncbi:unnamed protein product [Rotaria sp. Silwood1]|nr:unnamed protein product [Rotaria sp. Silwood1]CAF1008418.1 unnamed protein product [Rotaria sp. Silwood1]CAF3398359.1 unnamed protein product [Rotaria sp. Silwood1]CAF3416796.1 unnamed protein product [Rotaria sp. Silwood1]CAF4559826.1 unnamed protein product [Rotaria sp. Silwood1]